MSVAFVIRESRDGAREGRQWELCSSRRRLTVGREKSCDIHLHSQSVESEHAVFEWSPESEAYVIRDLGPVNATYVNGRPLRGATAVLCHGDAIRFGYERRHFFRIEEVKDSQPSPSSPPSPPSQPSQHPQGTVLAAPSASTQTSPQDPPPPPATAAAAQQAPVSVQFLAGQPHTILVPTPVQATPQAPPTISQYYVPGFGYPPPAMLPHPHNPNMAFQPFGHIQTTPPTMLQQSQHQVVPVAQSTPGHAHFSQLTTPTTSFSHTPLTVEDLELHPPPLSPSSSSPPQSQHPLGSSSSSSSKRKDGRRAVPSPSKAGTSGLYGQPAWWGEEEEEGSTGGSEPELDIMTPRSQILRDFTRNLRSNELEDTSSPVPGITRAVHSSSSTDLLRKQAISNLRERDSVSPSSSLLDFTAPAKRKKPARLLSDRRPRSADPSPVRSSRSVSPSASNVAIATRKRTGSQSSSEVSLRSSPTTTGHVTPPTGHVTPPTGHVSRKNKSGSPVRGSSKTPLGHVTGHVSRRSASLSAGKPPKPASKRRVTKTGSKKQVRTKLPAGSESVSIIPSSEALIPIPKPVSEDSECLESITSTPTSCRNDQTYTTNLSSEGSHSSSADLSGASAPDPALVTPTGSHALKRSRSEVKGRLERVEAVSSNEAFTRRPNSARKQWDTATPQGPDSLMLASIEARMRRLTKMAEASAALVSSSSSLQTLPPSQQWRQGKGRKEEGKDSGAAAAGSGGDSPTTPVEDSLPEWKFFNKEAESIFHSIRTVEKWLQDINSSVSEMRISEGGVAVGVASNAQVEEAGFVSCDHTQEEEGSVFEDSIEEQYFSCSDNEGGGGGGKEDL